jgi:hypothetical protein
MAEQVKLQHLWRGIKPSLVEKFWSMKPATTDEFLTEVKRYQEMTSKTRHEEWAMGMLGNQMPPVENGRLDRLEKMLEGLMGAIGTRGTGKPTADGAEENGWSRGAETAGERNGGGRGERRWIDESGRRCPKLTWKRLYDRIVCCSSFVVGNHASLFPS